MTKVDLKKDQESGDVEDEKRNRKVDLSGLSLGSVPDTSVNLAAVAKFDLSNNNLQSIPESLFAQTVNLVVLDLHSNQLRKLPNSIGCLSKLKILNVSSNLLEYLPNTIEDCRSLEELTANFNKLHKLPETMGFELINLKKLSVNSNKLAFLPHSTTHMTSLKVLDVRLNCLGVLPEGLENLIHLEVLNISQNFHYIQMLPDSIGFLISLVELDVSYNKISTLPNSIGRLSKLRKLSTTGNPLVIPPADVVEMGVEAVREYLSARMSVLSTPPMKKRSWLMRMVKCGANDVGTASYNMLVEDNEGSLLSEYYSIGGPSTPASRKQVGGIFSPRRLLSPWRSTPRR